MFFGSVGTSYWSKIELWSEWHSVGMQYWIPAAPISVISAIANETLVTLMGLKNPVGQTIGRDAIKDKHFTALGVVKDMVMESPFASPSPTIFFIYPKDGENCILLKLNPNITATTAIE